MAAKNLIELSRDRCSGCGVCADVCPELVLEKRGRQEPVGIAHPERCLGCMSCEEDCARGALRVLRLPDGLELAQVPPPAAGLDPERIHDLVIVGAGPAGLATALRARSLGLSAVVVDRLPSPRRAHHPDGGLLVTAPDLPALVDAPGGGLRIPELDVTLPASAVRGRIRYFTLVGPRGQASPRGRGISGGAPLVRKDAMMEALAAAAAERGATIAWNTRAEGISFAGGLASVALEGGLRVRGRVAVCAEGISGRLAHGAGIPVNAAELGWSYGAALEWPALAAATDECGFAVGNPGAPAGEPQLMAYFCSSAAFAEWMPGTLQRGRERVGDRPLHAVAADWLARDGRFAGRMGGALAVATPPVDGCRTRMRRFPRTAVSDGIIAVGDAVTACGQISSLGALRTGTIAAEEAARALASGDASRRGLAGFDRRLRGVSTVTGMRWLSGPLVEAPLGVSAAELDRVYDLLSWLDMGAVQSGGLRAAWALARFMGRLLPAAARGGAAPRLLTMREAG